MCLDCLQIVASQRPEAQLERFEQDHTCKSSAAAQRERTLQKRDLWHGFNRTPFLGTR